MLCQCCSAVANTLDIINSFLGTSAKHSTERAAVGKLTSQPDKRQPSSKVCLLWEETPGQPDYMDTHLQPTTHAHVSILEKVMFPTLSEHSASYQLNQSTLVTQVQPEVV